MPGKIGKFCSFVQQREASSRERPWLSRSVDSCRPRHSTPARCKPRVTVLIPTTFSKMEIPRTTVSCSKAWASPAARCRTHHRGASHGSGRTATTWRQRLGCYSSIYLLIDDVRCRRMRCTKSVACTRWCNGQGPRRHQTPSQFECFGRPN